MELIPLYLIYLFVVIAVCIRITMDTESPSKALAYIIVVVMFPLIGIIFYFSVGVNYRKKKLYGKKLIHDHKAFPELERQTAEYSKNELEFQRENLSYFFPLAVYSSKGRLSSNNNSAVLLTNGEEKFPSLIESIKAAKNHIHIEYYIYENDAIGTEIAELLIIKAKEGLEVRFIYDDFGSKSIRKEFIARMLNAGVQAVPFYKVNFIFFASRLNYRNHRKILVVDGITAYVGGINVSDKYCNNGKNQLYWRDTHLLIKGLSVMNLQYIFLTDWNFCAGEQIQFSGDYFPVSPQQPNYGNQLVQIISSGPDSEYQTIMYSLIQAILLSKKEVLITTPYFIPEKSFLDALKIATLSGVRIKIIVPFQSDSAFINAACNSYYQQLLELGIAIFQYRKGFIHAKTVVCDEFVSIIGTANLDNRSFDLNFEVNAIVYDRSLAKQLKVQFENDLNYSTRILLEEWLERPIATRTLERVVHLFSPLL